MERWILVTHATPKTKENISPVTCPCREGCQSIDSLILLPIDRVPFCLPIYLIKFLKPPFLERSYSQDQSAIVTAEGWGAQEALFGHLAKSEFVLSPSIGTLFLIYKSDALPSRNWQTGLLKSLSATSDAPPESTGRQFWDGEWAGGGLPNQIQMLQEIHPISKNCINTPRE
jgi:hypothetical protein